MNTARINERLWENPSHGLRDKNKWTALTEDFLAVFAQYV
jgi:hypothetical protein